jgi:hypothetical protein
MLPRQLTLNVAFISAASDLATTHDLAIVVVAIIGDPANDAYRQDNADTSDDRDINVIAINGGIAIW